VHFGATPIARKKLSQINMSCLKNNESDVILTENKDVESINQYKNSQSAISPGARKKRTRVTKESPKLVTPDERDWMEFINTFIGVKAILHRLK
jgi:hypothetical protein